MSALAAATGLAVVVVGETLLAVVWRFAPVPAIAVLAAALAGGAAASFLRARDRAARPAGGRRAEARLLIVAALALAVPVLVLPLPPDTDAQGFGLWALSIRDGGSLFALLPWRPGIRYLYAPGALTLFATLSSLVPRVPMSTVVMAAAQAAGLVFVALAGDLGEELAAWTPGGGAPDAEDRPEAWRRAGQIAALGSFGLWAALVDAHATAAVGLTLGLAALVAWLRAWRTLAWIDAARSGVLVAGLVLAHQDSALACALGLVPAFAAAWAAAADRRRILAVTAAGVALAGLLVAPWLAAIGPLLASGLASPFRPAAAHVRPFFLYQGPAGPLALVGLVLALRRRAAWALGLLAGLLLLFDFSTTGLLERALPSAAWPVTRFAYPFSLAWHGPVLPFLALATVAVAAAAPRVRRLAAFPGPRAALAAAAAVLVLGAAAHPLAAFARRRVSFYGVFGTAHDVAAMRWIARHAPREARVLNYPGDFESGRDWEGHWAPVVAERDCVYVRMAPFYLPAAGGGGPEDAAREQREMLAFWRDPADPANASRLARAGIGYVLVPDFVGDPAGDPGFRGRPPAFLGGTVSRPEDAPYLTRVFRAGGAAVYAVK